MAPLVFEGGCQKKADGPSRKSDWRPDQAPTDRSEAPRPAYKAKPKPMPRGAHDGTQNTPRKTDKRPAKPGKPAEATGGGAKDTRTSAVDLSKRFRPDGAGPGAKAFNISLNLSITVPTAVLFVMSVNNPSA